MSPSSKTSRHIALRRRSVQQTRQSSLISRARCWSVSTAHYHRQTEEQSPCGRAPLDPHDRGQRCSARCGARRGAVTRERRGMSRCPRIPPGEPASAPAGLVYLEAMIIVPCWTRLGLNDFHMAHIRPYGSLKLSNHTVFGRRYLLLRA